MATIILNTLNINKAVELLLQAEYFREFEVIDGLNQHPKGYNFYKWLLIKGLIEEHEYRTIELHHLSDDRE